jgi:sugar lactone lactonase YvrE
MALKDFSTSEEATCAGEARRGRNHVPSPTAATNKGLLLMRSRLIFAALLGIAVLAACTSTGTALNPPSGISGQRASHLVVTDVVNNSVLTFPATANGSVAPTSSLTGGSTGLIQPEGFFINSTRTNVWVGNYNSGSNGTITEYALGASGNTAPSVTLGGGSTTLQGPAGIYVDSSGTIYVADYDNSAVDIFSPGTTTQAPLRQIKGGSTGFGTPTGVWLDAGGNIWVGTENGSVEEFAPSANGNVAPINTISGSNTVLGYVMGVVFDSHGNLWVADAYNGIGASIEEFAPGATGNATPTRIITGASTLLDLPNGIAVDGAGYIYVGDYGAAAVYVFAPSANGNVAPIQTIPANGTTGITKPIGVLVY